MWFFFSLHLLSVMLGVHLHYRLSSGESAVKVYLSKDAFEPLKVLGMEIYNWDTV